MITQDCTVPGKNIYYRERGREGERERANYYVVDCPLKQRTRETFARKFKQITLTDEKPHHKPRETLSTEVINKFNSS
ncbi:hypothetical protein CDL12_19209 [Handroanthus impetiginosus]|uniref:Uncharacterized protein n=1 Tax=Handroanthus impetiginosus TaxID=429701 RepID=A0A2G9GSI2_9LAMI|nr:hypothetical protein CDL12_19209 [Handroanthus impetiginosus]